MQAIRLNGFSLIELMIVITIIGILTVIAIPSYQHYVKRARFTEVISAVEIFKTAISLAIQQGIALTELSNGQHNIPVSPKSSKNIENITVTNGVITATGTDIVDQATYILKTDSDGSTWTISGTCLQYGLCDA